MLNILNRVESWFTPQNATGFKPEAWRAKTQLDYSIVYVVGFLLLYVYQIIHSISNLRKQKRCPAKNHKKGHRKIS